MDRAWLTEPGEAKGDHRERHTKPQNVRPTIGVLIDTLISGYQFAVWQGVADLARRRDVNLLCFVGGMLHSANYFEAQRNTLYDLATAESVDGLVIVTGTIGNEVGVEELRDFCERYRPLPLVSIAVALGGIPSILLDNYHGMYDAATHLVKVHGYRRIAFIRKHEGHPEADERYRAYADVLTEHGIPLNPDLVVPGDYYEDPTSAICLLLDERGLRPREDFDALIAVDDHTALPALQALQQRGVQVPEDVAVVGFDDIEGGGYSIPPLTTVRQSLCEQGRRAAKMVLAQLQDEQVDQRVVLRGELVVRQSCGCLSPAVLEARGDQIERSGQSSVADSAIRKERILSEMAQAVNSSTGAVPVQVEQLADAFLGDLERGAEGDFLSVLSRILRSVALEGGDVATWQKVLSAMRRHALPYHEDDEALRQAERLWQQARTMVWETAHQAQEYQRMQAEHLAWAMREVGQALSTASDVEELMEVAARELPRLGVTGCYLSLYESHPEHVEEGIRFPTLWSRLMLAYNEGRRLEPEGGRGRFPSRRLVPKGLFPTDRQYAMVVEALYFPFRFAEEQRFREDQLGFVLFEIDSQAMGMSEATRSNLSSALGGVLLFQHNAELYEEALQARATAERADRLKTRLLANVSHELRTPLDVILGYTQSRLSQPSSYHVDLPSDLLEDIQHIHNSAEHLRRVIDDLLDLSRAEIDELDLHPELLDPRPFLEDVFQVMVGSAISGSEVVWRLELPNRLPLIQADPVRLRQILLNLLSNARKFTDEGVVALGAQVAPPYLHVWVQDTGIGIPVDLQELIFEPFITVENAPRRLEGIGLGLSVARRLVALHRGLMTLESQPGQGSTFHVYLPLPSLSDQPATPPASAHPVLLLISTHDRPSDDIIEFSQRQGLEVRLLRVGDDLDAILSEIQPAALAWDLTGASVDDWAVVWQLRNHRRLCRAPFILYGREPEGKPGLGVGMASFVVKPVSEATLLGAIDALRPPDVAGLILIVDDDPQARDLYESVVAKGLPGYSIATVGDGDAAVAYMIKETPSLVVLDLVMPGMDGFDVLDWMRTNPQTRRVPILVLTGRMLTFEDIKRLERHPQVTVQSKGILSEGETVAAVRRVMSDEGVLPLHTSALVKRAVAYLHQNYHRPLSRREMAEVIGVNKDYLSRIFRCELGLSPWEYLTRYRVERAKELLRHTSDTITSVAFQIGFSDPAYFSRVFRKQVGLSPSAFRELPE
jgi:signal transduction histidine kinase/DNA-binding LacI/PurR family transcriptional regulator/AraC-like DNA-binding protein/DNA-binding response OmpR family regulator